MKLPEYLTDRRRARPTAPPPPDGRRSRDELLRVQARLASLEQRLAQLTEQPNPIEEHHGSEWYG